MHSLGKRHLRPYMSAQRVKEAVQAGSFLRGLGGPRQTDGVGGFITLDNAEWNAGFNSAMIDMLKLYRQQWAPNGGVLDGDFFIKFGEFIHQKYGTTSAECRLP